MRQLPIALALSLSLVSCRKHRASASSSDVTAVLTDELKDDAAAATALCHEPRWSPAWPPCSTSTTIITITDEQSRIHPMSNEIDQAIARLRAGETLSGSFMHDHGLESPLVSCSTLRRDGDGDAFVFETWLEEPVVPTVPFQREARRVSEAEVRKLFETDSALKNALR
jgi:hypothetical protein